MLHLPLFASPPFLHKLNSTHTVANYPLKLSISDIFRLNCRETATIANIAPDSVAAIIKSAHPLWLSWLKRPTVTCRQSGDRKFEPSRGRYAPEIIFLVLWVIFALEKILRPTRAHI
jgi:hypothetical protein